MRISFGSAFIGQPWVLTGGTERYTGTVKSTPDDVKVDGIDDNSNPIVYTLTSQTSGGVEVTKNIQINKVGTYYPFGRYPVHLAAIEPVPWSSGTDEQITTIINALESGLLSMEETGWQVGDAREVTIGAIGNTDGDGNTVVGETHEEQQITRVIGHIGAPTGITRVDGGDIHFIIVQKKSLATYGYMNSTNTTSGLWNGSARRKWCNQLYYNAIPSVEKSWYKQMNIITDEASNVSIDWFALPAAREVFGDAVAVEGNILEQFTYYKDVNNRKEAAEKQTAWMRSKYSASNFYTIRQSGSADTYFASAQYGLIPFGSI